MEVKRLDTKITAVQKQLEAVEEAEGAGIDRATPKFSGIGYYKKENVKSQRG